MILLTNKKEREKRSTKMTNKKEREREGEKKEKVISRFDEYLIIK